MKPIAIAALTLLLQTTAQASAQQVAKAAIEGTAVRTGSGEPISGVRVILTRVPPQPAGNLPAPINGPPPVSATLPSATTDSQGKFALKDLEAGSYRVTFAANGYAKQDYGQRSFTGQGAPITVAAGQTAKAINIAMTPAGNVSGHIRDGAGLPAAGVPIQLSRVSYNANGQRGLQVVTVEITNDRGEYRLFWISPGRYYVNAGSAPGLSSRSFLGGPAGSPNLVPGQSFAYTFYPGVSDVNRALALDVAAGAEVSGIDFTVLPQRLLNVRGRLVDSRTGTAPSAVSVSALYQIFDSSGSTGGSNNYNASTGTFELANLVPGSYVVQAFVAHNNPSSPIIDSGSRVASNEQRYDVATQVPIELTSTDLEDVVLTLGRSPLSGRVTVDGTPPSSLSVLKVYLRPSRNGTITNSVGASLPPVPAANDDGTFRIDSVLPGEYRLAMPGLPDDLYIKGARYNQNDVLNKPLVYCAAESGILEIVVGSGAVQISGTAVDGQSRPAAGIPVVLVPDQNRDRIELYKNATTDANGRYSLRGIAPGDYKLFAWDSVDSFVWFDSDFLKSHEGQGRAIHVLESSNQVVDLKTALGN